MYTVFYFEVSTDISPLEQLLNDGYEVIHATPKPSTPGHSHGGIVYILRK